MRVSRQLIDTIAGCPSRRGRQFLLKQLLTPTEQVMLAKRLALILMIQKGYSYTTIGQTLKMTPTTINRFWSQVRQNKFSAVSYAKTKNVFLETLLGSIFPDKINKRKDKK